MTAAIKSSHTRTTSLNDPLSLCSPLISRKVVSLTERFEYICFSGVNDSDRHARALARLISGLYTRVNLIHFHPIPDSPLNGSVRPQMEAFQSILKEKGFTTTIRKSRGEDIFAACGLLSTKEKLKQKTDND